MKVLLTGSSGFVGSNLLPYLKGNDVDVVPLTRAELNKEEFDKSADVQAIVHLAGKAHDLKKTIDPQEYYIVNYELTKKIYLDFLSSKASKFIFISSVKASADTVLNELYETDEADPKTDYGKSKLKAEQYIQRQALPEGKSYYILRPSMIHGPGNKGNLNLLYSVIKKGLPYPLAAFENRRSFLSVENLCFVIREILRRDDIASGVYQVADDDTLSTNEVIRLIGRVAGKRARIWRLPQNLIRTLAKVGDVLHLPLTTERLSKLTESYVVSNSKIKAALGSSLPINSREGICKTIESFSSLKK